ncbi:MAG: plasmid pRiA4b ORF-3 family protein [Synechococcales cyanobacterium RM1_1_8]|nr:plasmid pRiA4b ORF-3 family protein [Synechococcales cyanobacterium RM1_1_8]
MAPRKSATIYQLKVTLQQIRPPIWRRLLVRSSTKLNELHEIIQQAMGWGNYHMHSFSIHNRDYGVLDPDWGMDDMEDETRVTLAKVVPGEKFRFRYMYDFGDGWDHEILVEKVLPLDAKLTYPTCIKGKRACPPEDCGGPWGYEELIGIMGDPQHPEYEERLDWLEQPLDPDAFDLDEVNAALIHLAD